MTSFPNQPKERKVINENDTELIMFLVMLAVAIPALIKWYEWIWVGWLGPHLIIGWLP